MSNGLMMFKYILIGFTVACVSIDVTVVGSSSWNRLEERRVSDDSVILTRCSDHGTFLGVMRCGFGLYAGVSLFRLGCFTRTVSPFAYLHDLA